MLLRSPPALFGFNGRDRPQGRVAGVLTDCFSLNTDNQGGRGSFQDLHAELGRINTRLKNQTEDQFYELSLRFPNLSFGRHETSKSLKEIPNFKSAYFCLFCPSGASVISLYYLRLIEIYYSPTFVLTLGFLLSL